MSIFVSCVGDCESQPVVAGSLIVGDCESAADHRRLMRLRFVRETTTTTLYNNLLCIINRIDSSYTTLQSQHNTCPLFNRVRWLRSIVRVATPKHSILFLGREAPLGETRHNYTLTTKHSCVQLIQYTSADL